MTTRNDPVKEGDGWTAAWRLHVGDPSRAVDFDETPEGHAVRFDREGNVVGLTSFGRSGS